MTGYRPRLLIVHSFYRVPGGEDAYVRRQVKLLKEREWDVHLLEESSSGLGNLEASGRLILGIGSRGTTRARIREVSPEVVHLHNYWPTFGPAVHLETERRRIPLVVTVHNFRLRCPNGLCHTQEELCQRCVGGNHINAVLHECFDDGKQAATYALALWAHRFIFRMESKVSLFISPSDFMRDRLISWGLPSEKIMTIRNFAPVKPWSSAGAGTFGLFLGRASREKGLPILLQALRAAGDPPFIIAGGGPLEGQMRALAEQMSLKHVEFTGQVSPTRVEELLGQARFLVVPSLSEENAPLAAIEAMGAARPIIVSERGGLNELVTTGGGISVAPGDVTGLAAAIGELMSDDERCDEVGRRAHLFAEAETAPEKHAELLGAVYATACGRTAV